MRGPEAPAFHASLRSEVKMNACGGSRLTQLISDVAGSRSTVYAQAFSDGPPYHSGNSCGVIQLVYPTTFKTETIATLSHIFCIVFQRTS